MINFIEVIFWKHVFLEVTCTEASAGMCLDAAMPSSLDAAGPPSGSLFLEGAPPTVSRDPPLLLDVVVDWL